MSLSGRGRRRKGHDFERKIAARYRETFPRHEDSIRRSDQGNGAAESDVTGLPMVWTECEHAKSPNPLRKLEQAIEDAPPGYLPVAVTHATKAHSSEATMRLSDLVRIWMVASESAAAHAPVTIDFEDFLALMKLAHPRLVQPNECERCKGPIGCTVYRVGDDRVCGDCAAKAVGCDGIDREVA